jgi:hypothetical protein
MKSNLKTLFLFLVLGLVTTTVFAETPAPAPTTPTIDQRVADIEAYFNNVGVGAAGDVKWTSNIPGSGPGHNGWMMVCAALVLFMTLPGLALFYGGLTRAKNILSVMAQCMGIAGLVAILWWAFGYSFVFGKSFENGIPRRNGISVPQRRRICSEHGLCILGFSERIFHVSDDVRNHHACSDHRRDC